MRSVVEVMAASCGPQRRSVSVSVECCEGRPSMRLNYHRGVALSLIVKRNLAGGGGCADRRVEEIRFEGEFAAGRDGTGL